jgi:hypothetical protein
MIEYRRKEEAEGRKEIWEKKRNGPDCTTREALHVKQVVVVFIFIT